MEKSNVEKFIYDTIFGEIDKVANPYVFSVEDNQEVNITDISRKGNQRGKKCNCICPACNGVMLAVFPKNGKAYFRHYDPEGKSECLKNKRNNNR